MDRSGPPPAQTQGEVGHRLVVLMAARLALSLISLGIALALEAVEGTGSNTQPLGLYGTVVFALMATVAYGLMLGRTRRPARFAAINIATDIAIVSALVHFSGGADSIFTFLYVLVAVYGALLFERRGALAAAGIGVISYGAVLLAGQNGWLGPGSPVTPIAVLFTVWAIHAGAMTFLRRQYTILFGFIIVVAGLLAVSPTLGWRTAVAFLLPRPGNSQNCCP